MFVYFVLGEITFTTTSASKTYVNLPTKNITSLIQQFAKKTVQIQTIESANGTNIPIDEAMFQKRMTVSELLDSDWSHINISPLTTLPTL